MMLINASLTLSEIAVRRGTSVHTVRNQVKAALSKTDSRRQADLSRLVESLKSVSLPPAGASGGSPQAQMKPDLRGS